MRNRVKKLIKTVTVIILMAGIWHVSASGYMLSKAWLSQYLIKEAWQQTLADKLNHKPWSWADTYPIAELRVKRLAMSGYVLEGSSARNLAFSATHLENSGMPGQNKTIVVSGHRDSHFEYLQNLKIGDEIELNTINGLAAYVVNQINVVNSKNSKIRILNKEELLLTTCYPFGALSAGGNLRFVVYATPVS